MNFSNSPKDDCEQDLVNYSLTESAFSLNVALQAGKYGDFSGFNVSEGLLKPPGDFHTCETDARIEVASVGIPAVFDF